MIKNLNNILKKLKYIYIYLFIIFLIAIVINAILYICII